MCIYVQYFDAQNSKKMQFTTIQNTCNMVKHFEKLTSETNILNAIPYIKHVHSSLSHLLKTWSSSLHSNTIAHSPVEIYVWFTVALVPGNKQVVAIMTDSIQLWQGIWVLAWGEWVDFSAPFIAGKMHKCRIWLKLKSLLAVFSQDFNR